MFGLDLKLAIGAGLAVGGILLLAFTGEPEAPKEPVAITPPPAMSWDSEWVPGATPQPPAAEAGIPASAPAADPGQSGDVDAGSAGPTGPVEDPYAG